MVVVLLLRCRTGTWVTISWISSVVIKRLWKSNMQRCQQQVLKTNLWISTPIAEGKIQTQPRRKFTQPSRHCRANKKKINEEIYPENDYKNEK